MQHSHCDVCYLYQPEVIIILNSTYKNLISIKKILERCTCRNLYELHWIRHRMHWIQKKEQSERQPYSVRIMQNTKGRHILITIQYQCAALLECLLDNQSTLAPRKDLQLFLLQTHQLPLPMPRLYHAWSFLKDLQRKMASWTLVATSEKDFLE